MEPLILLALYASLGYLGSMALVAQAGVRLLHSGQARQAAACFRLGAALYPGRRNRILMRSNLLAALSILGDHESVNREWKSLEPRLADAGPYAPLAVACYAASLYYQGRYQEGLHVTGRPEACLSEAERASFMAQDGEALRLLNRSSCQLATGQLDGARDSLAQAERLVLQHPVMVQHLELAKARLAYREGDLARAAEIAGALEDGEVPDIYEEELVLLRAVILAQAGRPDEAEKLLDRRVQHSSPRGFLYRPLAEGAVAEQRGDGEAALDRYRAALKSGQPAGEPALRGGRLAEARGDLAAACDFYQEALRTDPESCWATMAHRALLRLGEAPRPAA